ncbi:glucose-6-phosphate dehydrogenase [Mycotypha africana]|uniref:glucose-6-phosphate dehydrogenase n=1 Tax=Mycotypha africana TaxID=64632 RepID=UPI002301E083|nr:glucose-6-phosphate dehydrogenase [Mycotypha africana]KAI8975190.1 glucose-6-phosphate dehydrogenase [Mycotypha africana]
MTGNDTAINKIKEQVRKNLNGGVSIVIIGASGDLAKKKTFPALFKLYQQKFFPEKTQIIGYARTEMDDEEYHKRVTMSIDTEKEEGVKDFLKICHYVSGQYDEDDSFKKLNDFVNDVEKKNGVKDDQKNRIFYLAVPAQVYVPVSERCKKFVYQDGAYNALIVEKPFGKDSDTYKQFAKDIYGTWDRNEVYLIDHYLGKELLKNMMNLRFANTFFEPMWNSKYIDNVQITLKEPFGCEGRGGYFDEYGAIRDVIQNHLLQVFNLIAMDRPKDASPEAVAEEKTKLLNAVKPIKLEDTLLGQYTRNGDKPAYQEDDTVEDGSLTSTFATVVLWIDNERWSNVPFIIKSGKAMDNYKCEARIQFKKLPGDLFKDTPRNELVINIEPDEAVYLKLNSKHPGYSDDNLVTDLDLTYKERYDNLKIPKAYEALIVDVMRGRHANFVGDDELQASWRVFTPLLHQIEKEKIKPEPYPHGTRGPEKLDEFVKKYGVERLSDEDYEWPSKDLDG